MTTMMVEQDDSPESPREWDNLGVMYCEHRNYNLGDKDAEYPLELDNRDRLVVKKNIAVILPLYLYEHGGMTMNTSGFSCPWDSGQVGYIYVTREKVYDEYGWKRITRGRREKLDGYLRNEVETYDQYLTGEVYGYIVENDGEIVDSCWGFYGYEYCEQEGEAVLQGYLDKEKASKEHVLERLTVYA